MNDKPTQRSSTPGSVLMTADTVGGVWTFAVELARALNDRHVQVTLATMGGYMSQAQREQCRKLPNLDVIESRYRLEWMDEPWEDVRKAGEWLLDIEDRLRPDTIHLNGFAHGYLPWRAPVMVTGHSCVVSWWEAVKGEAPPLRWKRYRSEVTRGLRAAGIVAAPSRAMLTCLERHYGPLHRTVAIPNGRNARAFAPAHKAPVVFAAGRLWDEAKNISALDGVAGSLPWPIYVAGDNKHPDGDRVRRSKVELLGVLSGTSMAEWFGRAAIFAHPARYEPFGLCVLEAALSGCALVLGDIGSLRENWDHCALFVQPEDSEDLAHALRLLMNDEGLRAKLAARACARALSLTPERMADSYLKAYQSIARFPEVRTCA